MVGGSVSPRAAARFFFLALLAVLALALWPAGAFAQGPSCAPEDSFAAAAPTGGGNCPAGKIRCGKGKCVDVASDRRNCGACGNACLHGQICSNGQCSGAGGSGTCATGQVKCPSGCVDVTTNRRNCGQCGHVCGKGQSCSNGTCVGGTNASGGSCAAGQIKCGKGKCTDVSTDPKNCGRCGNVCGKGQSCSNGTCSGCATGQVKCPNGCFDLNTSPRNCGQCGHACGRGQTCSNGQCSGSGAGSSGACQAGQIKCGNGKCTDVATDPRNCGMCGNRCLHGQACSNGQCSGAGGAGACATGQVKCPNGCFDLNTSRRNCGTCGNVCGRGLTCSNGVCRAAITPPTIENNSSPKTFLLEEPLD